MNATPLDRPNSATRGAVASETGYVTPAAQATRMRLGALSLAIAGILFVLYPAIRPFSDETSLQGAAAFASPEWMIAHMLGMVGFTLVGIGLLALYIALQRTPAERFAFWALAMSLLGIGFTLPYYGGEAFGLHAIGQEALSERSSHLVSLAAVVRGGPEVVMFVLGLLLLAIGAIMAAVAVWRSGTLARWSGVPFALAFALYIPQFFGTQPLRMAHGLLVAAGCLWIAVGMWRQTARVIPE